MNTVPRDGRAACIQCSSCVGFPCPSDAKNGTQNTVLKRALATGNLTLVTGAVCDDRLSAGCSSGRGEYGSHRPRRRVGEGDVSIREREVLQRWCRRLR